MLSKPPASHPGIPPTRHGIGATLLSHARNPSRLVRSLYLSPSFAPHALVSGSTAETIGKEQGETLVDPSYFWTEHRWREHRRGLGLPEEPLPHFPGKGEPQNDIPSLDQLSKGTVGAVALDNCGCIAVLTSTGGRTNKLVGRIGDTPMMGAGFWAEEWKSTSLMRKILDKIKKRDTRRSVGISGTGDGDVSNLAVLREEMIGAVRAVFHQISDSLHDRPQDAF